MKTKRTFAETELFMGCLRHDPAIQNRLFETYSGKMYALCLRYVKETTAAEDVLTVGFMKVFDKIHQFKGTGSFGGWIRKIMVNECLMYLEKTKNLYDHIGLGDIIPPQVHTQPTDGLDVEDLMKLVNSLPTGYRTVFNLFAIEGFSHQEIAEKLQISQNTSKSQLSHARVLLQKMVTNRPQKSKLLSA